MDRGVWDDGLAQSVACGMSQEDYEDVVGPRPADADYMPEWDPKECTNYQMYKDGVPASDVMSSPKMLAHQLAVRFSCLGFTVKQWLEKIMGDLIEEPIWVSAYSDGLTTVEVTATRLDSEYRASLFGV
jgi:hypothetical protein